MTYRGNFTREGARTFPPFELRAPQHADTYQQRDLTTFRSSIFLPPSRAAFNRLTNARFLSVGWTSGPLPSPSV